MQGRRQKAPRENEVAPSRVCTDLPMLFPGLVSCLHRAGAQKIPHRWN